MNVRRVFESGLVTGLLALAGGFTLDSACFAQARLPAPASEGIEVLTRGPVHEAFAGALASDPEPGLVIQERPPQAIEELPPRRRIQARADLEYGAQIVLDGELTEY